MLGPPTTETRYVLRWHLAAGLNLAFDRRSPGGWVWLPWLDTPVPPEFAVRRTPEDRVNSNVYTAPSLHAGNLVELRATTTDELYGLLGYVQVRRALV